MPRRPPGLPSPQPIKLFQSPPASNNNDGAMPLAYDRGWQHFTNLTPEQVAWFQAQPEWQNYISWVGLNPAQATIHANAPDDATIQATLTAAKIAVAVNPTPLPAVSPLLAQRGARF